jgi:hypothetical protein
MRDRTRQTRREVYLNFMTPEQQSEFHRLEAREQPESMLLAYLQKIGAYQAFMGQPEDVREAIVHRRIVGGMTPLQVRMAWGAPLRSRDMAMPADRAADQERIVWDYVFFTYTDGAAEYQRSVCFLNNRVIWMRSAIP